MAKNTRDTADSWFWARVQKLEGGCWIWKGAILPTGYGLVDMGGKKLYAHRASYLLTHGSIPDGMYICHSCDNTACVNPGHLWSGTRQDNMRDMVMKERGSSVLSKADVVSIRALYSAGDVTRTDLARRYKVSPSAISRIVRGDAWKLAEGPVVERVKKIRNTQVIDTVQYKDPSVRLDEADVIAIRMLYSTGEVTQAELASRYNIRQTTVSRIVRGTIWRDVAGPVLT